MKNGGKPDFQKNGEVSTYARDRVEHDESALGDADLQQRAFGVRCAGAGWERKTHDEVLARILRSAHSRDALRSLRDM